MSGFELIRADRLKDCPEEINTLDKAIREIVRYRTELERIYIIALDENVVEGLYTKKQMQDLLLHCGYIARDSLGIYR